MSGNKMVVVTRLGTIVASALVISLIASMMTTLPYGRAFHDLFTLLDGAYRVSVGQLPGVDFASPIGPLLLYFMRWGQILWPAGHDYVTYHAITWLFMLPPMAVLSLRLRSGLAFAGAFALLAVMILLPMTLDDTYLSEISYFASYNRFASGLLFLLSLWLVLPKGRIDGVLLAYLLLLMAFIKITAGMVGLGMLICAVILGRASLRIAIEALCLLVAVLLLLDVSTGMVSGYLHDIGTMIALNEGGGLYKLFYYGFNNWLVLFLLGLLVLSALYKAVSSSELSRLCLVDFTRTVWQREAFIVDAVLITVAVWGAESQNTGSLGLIPAAAIFFHPAAWREYRLVNMALLAALVFPVADMAVKRSIRAYVRENKPAPVQPLEPMVKGTRVPFTTYEGARFFSEIFRDKLELTREVQNNRFFITLDPTSNAPAAQLALHMDTIEAARLFEERGYRKLANHYASLYFSDPFGMMLGLMPAKGTMLTMDADRTVPRFNDEQAHDYLKTVDGVFVGHCDLHNEEFDKMFANVLEAEFDGYPLTQCWSFYARKQP
ncbi:hypothetical protein SAMN04515647_2897 [Cohaesibacter sp. ES.047]|uniref:hypothetical protein n=1 Tax=Cohaesibacter sp. ES.047 TaxID=1798205 RepID=UPI000BB7070F|nr:hypothetical protein [Cohaesibacter sp. ES.047]SNY92627.1 hypothetical protein SAMN04515647_2897 [Cohaesibacter sp. ES.047]